MVARTIVAAALLGGMLVKATVAMSGDRASGQQSAIAMRSAGACV